jgi:hypothetical protein
MDMPTFPLYAGAMFDGIEPLKTLCGIYAIDKASALKSEIAIPMVCYQLFLMLF